MTETTEKIVIYKHELESAPTTSAEAGTFPIVFRDIPRHSFSRRTLAVSTLVPGLNCWIWWKQRQFETAKRQQCIFATVMAATYSILFLVCVGAFLAWPRPTWLERLDRAADSSVVKIQTSDGGFGTGVVIASHQNRHLVLTNRHVVSVTSGIWMFAKPSLEDSCLVILRSGAVLSGSVIAIPKDNDVDLALIIVQSNELQPLGPLRSFADVKKGERVAAIGHPGGLDFTITDGIVSAKRDGLELQTSAPAFPGNSGGPLVDEHGRIVGINTWGLAQTQGFNFAIRADYVLRKADWQTLHGADISDLLAKLGEN